MKIEMGESLFYSWLRHVKGCQIVQTNWKVSTKWEKIMDDTKLNQFIAPFKDVEDIKGLFKSKIEQTISQAECDALGYNLTDKKIYAVDVAFHENGVNYGKDTVNKVVFKCIRTVLCICQFINLASIDHVEVIFAAPKMREGIKDAIDKKIKTSIKKWDLNKEISQKIDIRLIVNEDFNDLVLKPILLDSQDVADTNELFVRSYKLLQMLNNNRYSKKIQSNNINVSKKQKTYSEMAVTYLIRVVISEYLDEKKEKKLLKQLLELNWIKKIEEIGDDQEKRYLSKIINISGEQYRLSNNRHERDREKVMELINEYVIHEV